MTGNTPLNADDELALWESMYVAHYRDFIGRLKAYRKKHELQARIYELSSVYIYHPQHAQGTLKTDRPMGEVTVQERLNELVSELKQEQAKLKERDERK